MSMILKETKAGMVLDWNDRSSIQNYIDHCWSEHLNGVLTVGNADISGFTRRNLTRRMAQLFDKIIEK
jgi:hypothetical protein